MKFSVLIAKMRQLALHAVFSSLVVSLDWIGVGIVSVVAQQQVINPVKIESSDDAAAMPLYDPTFTVNTPILVDAASQQRQLNLLISAVVIGDGRREFLFRGRWYHLNDELLDQWVVKAITSDYLLFTHKITQEEWILNLRK